MAGVASTMIPTYHPLDLPLENPLYEHISLHGVLAFACYMTYGTSSWPWVFLQILVLAFQLDELLPSFSSSEHVSWMFSTASPERQWLVVGVVVLPCAYICSVFCTASCVFLLSTYCMAGWVFRLVAVAWLIMMYDNADRVVANKYFAFFIGVVRL